MNQHAELTEHTQRSASEVLIGWYNERTNALWKVHSVGIRDFGQVVSTDVTRRPFLDETLEGMAMITGEMTAQETHTYLGHIYAIYEQQTDKGIWEFIHFADAETRAIAAILALNLEKKS